QDGAVIAAHGCGGFDQRTVDRGKAERERDQRQRDEEDRVADRRGPRLPISANRRPEGQEAERGDDRRQDEWRDAEQAEDVRPRRDAPPEEPRERQRHQHRDGRRGGSERNRIDQGRTPAVVGKDLVVPVQRKALRREGQRLLLVDRNAGDDDQRPGKEQRDQREDDATKPDLAHASPPLRAPTSRVSPTKASDISTRNTAIAAAKGMFDW